MGRIRSIKPDLPQSGSMGRVSREARLCFILLWTFVDDSGRARGNSRMLASVLYPYDEDAGKKIDGWLGELERAGCIRRYRAAGEDYLDIPNWLKHQKIDKPSPSKIPAFDERSPNPPRTIDDGYGSGSGLDMEGKPLSDSPSAPSDVVPLPNQNGKPSKLRQDASTVLEFLNKRTEHFYRPKDNTLKPIMARLKEGYTISECKAVIVRKWREWNKDEKMAKYLRPATLFGAEKFAQYVGEVPSDDDLERENAN